MATTWTNDATHTTSWTNDAIANAIASGQSIGMLLSLTYANVVLATTWTNDATHTTSWTNDVKN